MENPCEDCTYSYWCVIEGENFEGYMCCAPGSCIRDPEFDIDDY